MDGEHEDLVTKRLSLRRPVGDDVDVILAVHRDRRACAHNPSDALGGRAEAEALFERWDQHWTRHGFGYWVLRRRPDAEPVGFCGLKMMPFGDQTVLNLLYRLAPAFWGKGFATEAAATVVEWAGRHQPERPVIARVRRANTPSVRVASRAGLARAADLDGPGEDGLDLIFVSHWPAAEGA